MIQNYRATYRHGRIECDADHATIAAAVHANGVVLLKQVFEPAALVRLRDRVFEWSLGVDPQIEADTSFHRIDHLPKKSQTPHIFHAFNFYLRDDAIDPGLDTAIRPYFAAMQQLQNGLTDNDADFAPDAQGRFLRPQIIQYPSGGGFFDSHTHPYLPQKIGLIVSLSQQGADFDTGGTRFEFEGSTISIENHHEMGDIALFRSDIPHWITPIDSTRDLDWKRQRGRWIMVLSFY